MSSIHLVNIKDFKVHDYAASSNATKSDGSISLRQSGHEPFWPSQSVTHSLQNVWPHVLARHDTCPRPIKYMNLMLSKVEKQNENRIMLASLVPRQIGHSSCIGDSSTMGVDCAGDVKTSLPSIATTSSALIGESEDEDSRDAVFVENGGYGLTKSSQSYKS